MAEIDLAEHSKAMITLAREVSRRLVGTDDDPYAGVEADDPVFRDEFKSRVFQCTECGFWNDRDEESSTPDVCTSCDEL